jgi:predicted helicase
MKIGLTLWATGYRFAANERAQIYLTNSLEPPSDIQRDLPSLSPALAHEAEAVNTVKRDKRFTAVIGNPPYAGHSANTGEWINRLVDDYLKVNGKPIDERNAKWLRDDYVKFLRLSQNLIQLTGTGLLGMITNHGYLDNPTFRGMRVSLSSTFPSAALLDLHGNANKRERAPDGSADENVFEIRQGVAISLLRRSANAAERRQTFAHASLWGSRESKYEVLGTTSFSGTEWTPIIPAPPLFLWVPQNIDIRSEYQKGWRLPDAFPVSSLGIVTARDDLTIRWQSSEVWKTVENLISLRPEEARREYQLGPDVRDWTIVGAQRDLRESGPSKSKIVPLLYRPFDVRFTYYTGHSRGFHCMPRGEVMNHMVRGHNLGLIATRQTRDKWDVLATRFICGHKACAAYDSNSLFPLYLVNRSDLATDEASKVNLNPRFLCDFTARLKRTDTKIDPADIFHYAYAIFQSPGYRSRYAEFLKIDFPRLPLTGNLELFRALAKLGGELVALHLLESTKLEKPRTEFIGSNRTAEKVSHSNNTVWTDKAQTTGFRSVPEEVWNFHIGGYQVCEKWLKDRRGRKLSKEDIAHYHKIVIALAETIRLMKEIDKVIEKHGGWPGAFSAKVAKSSIG